MLNVKISLPARCIWMWGDKWTRLTYGGIHWHRRRWRGPTDGHYRTAGILGSRDRPYCARSGTPSSWSRHLPRNLARTRRRDHCTCTCRQKDKALKRWRTPQLQLIFRTCFSTSIFVCWLKSLCSLFLVPKISPIAQDFYIACVFLIRHRTMRDLSTFQSCQGK